MSILIYTHGTIFYIIVSDIKWVSLPNSVAIVDNIEDLDKFTKTNPVILTIRDVCFNNARVPCHSACKRRETKRESHGSDYEDHRNPGMETFAPDKVTDQIQS